MCPGNAPKPHESYPEPAPKLALDHPQCRQTTTCYHRELLRVLLFCSLNSSAIDERRCRVPACCGHGRQLARSWKEQARLGICPGRTSHAHHTSRTPFFGEHVFTIRLRGKLPMILFHEQSFPYLLLGVKMIIQCHRFVVRESLSCCSPS